MTAHQDLVRRARQATGCVDVAISADALDPTRVNIFELWQSEEDLDAWRTVANAPDTGITAASDDVMMYVVSDVRPRSADDTSGGRQQNNCRPKR